VTSCKTVLSLAVLLIASVPLALAQATYTTIDFPGATSTVAAGIDAAGDIVGTFVDSSNRIHGFLLSGGVYTQLDVPGGANETNASGINDVGQIVGSTDTNPLGLFVYDIPTQTYTTYSDGNNGGFLLAGGINNTGLVVGWEVDVSGKTIGLELKNSMFKKVRIPGATSTQLTSINNSGAVIAIEGKSGTAITYLYSGGTFTQIVIPGQPSGYAVAINDSNVLAGDYIAPAHDSAFEWQQGGLFKPINEPQQHNTYALAINNAGQVVGYYLDSSFNAHGYLWTPPADAEKK
jgi:probable HAF family extracellular repeat protein